jgi:hypothetical protein
LGKSDCGQVSLGVLEVPVGGSWAGSSITIAISSLGCFEL